jgi:hypothetical protein
MDQRCSCDYKVMAPTARHRFRAVAMLVALLTACTSDNANERVAATTLAGAGLGVPGGPIGVAVGAGVGAAAGLLIPEGVLDRSSQQSKL